MCYKVVVVVGSLVAAGKYGLLLGVLASGTWVRTPTGTAWFTTYDRGTLPRVLG